MKTNEDNIAMNLTYNIFVLGFPGGTVVKNPPASAGYSRDAGSVPGSGRPPGGGHSNPLQYSSWRIP